MRKSIPEIFECESKFCRIVWEYEPVTGGALVKLSAERLGWKKSTVYTVIKRLVARGVLSSENGVVTSLVSKQAHALSLISTISEKYFDGDFDALVDAWKNPHEKTTKKSKVTTAKDLYGASSENAATNAVKAKKKSTSKAKTSVQKASKQPEEQPSKPETAAQTKAIPSFLL